MAHFDVGDCKNMFAMKESGHGMRAASMKSRPLFGVFDFGVFEKNLLCGVVNDDPRVRVLVDVRVVSV